MNTAAAKMLIAESFTETSRNVNTLSAIQGGCKGDRDSDSLYGMVKSIRREEYLDAREVAEKWELTVRYIQTLCRHGDIEGAIKREGKWYIPVDSEKPEDHRITSGKYKGWRKKYHVKEKIDPALKRLIRDVHENAENYSVRSGEGK
ncbi:hypothetical protein [Oribacterium sp. WCC10]|uniref:hypothetical protein n=1 Tax=Oribacterium sp. WCC10 TaxID=1855343 RepID=UPI0008F1378D|nr:hypothetical protein [Oribacterium sp. WCC10]SFG65437.1 hypothetical protein SAMN05216356_11739 [Oribacterium sp. WCC10]